MRISIDFVILLRVKSDHKKKLYYHEFFDKIKSKIKRTWKVINSVIKRYSVFKKSQITSKIEGGIQYYNSLV